MVVLIKTMLDFIRIELQYSETWFINRRIKLCNILLLSLYIAFINKYGADARWKSTINLLEAYTLISSCESCIMSWNVKIYSILLEISCKKWYFLLFNRKLWQIWSTINWRYHNYYTLIVLILEKTWKLLIISIL